MKRRGGGGGGGAFFQEQNMGGFLQVKSIKIHCRLLSQCLLRSRIACNGKWQVNIEGGKRWEGAGGGGGGERKKERVREKKR